MDSSRSHDPFAPEGQPDAKPAQEASERGSGQPDGPVEGQGAPADGERSEPQDAPAAPAPETERSPDGVQAHEPQDAQPEPTREQEEEQHVPES